MDDRHLDWDGCFNARDLGGLRTSSGRTTRRGAVVRADALDHLSADGWAALRAHGVRTIIDLRNGDERAAAQAPAGLTSVHLPLDGVEDREFWDSWDSGAEFGTPLYYGPHLARFPERSAAVVAAIAHARPGGVLFHCAGGRDRTGMIAMLVLALAGVAAEDIAADYGLSAERIASSPAAGQSRAIEEFLAGRGTSPSGALLATLAALDLDALGLGERDVSALRARLLG